MYNQCIIIIYWAQIAIKDIVYSPFVVNSIPAHFIFDRNICRDFLLIGIRNLLKTVERANRDRNTNILLTLNVILLEYTYI